jgi:putative transposase
MLFHLMSLPERKHPAKGVFDDDRLPTVILLTLCTTHRRSWLGNQSVHDTLINVWLSATHWEVGPYVLMPDHLHLFAWPRALGTDFDGWVRFWKSIFSKTVRDHSLRWQTGCFHHRLRSCESAEEKRQYMIMNPVRAGLVNLPEEWPFQGQIFESAYLW